MKTKTLTDVIKIMQENLYDFIGEDIKTIGANGKRRIVLLFERRHGHESSNVDVACLIDDSFKVEKYNNGNYYQVYRCL